jgi:hypothetical protein
LAGSFYKGKVFEKKKKSFYIGKTPGKTHICCTGKLIFQGKTAGFGGKNGLFCVIMIQKGTVEGGGGESKQSARVRLPPSLPFFLSS